MAIKHTFRWKAPGSTKEVGTKTESLTPTRAIRRFCYECMGFCEKAGEAIDECPSTTCALHPFRKGKAHKKGGGK